MRLDGRLCLGLGMDGAPLWPSARRMAQMMNTTTTPMRIHNHHMTEPFRSATLPMPRACG